MGGVVQGQELDLTFLVDPYQLRVFYDSKSHIGGSLEDAIT